MKDNIWFKKKISGGVNPPNFKLRNVDSQKIGLKGSLNIECTILSQYKIVV